MFEILPESRGEVVGIKVSGKLTDEDYKGVLIPALERTFEAHGKVRMVLLFEDFHGWDAHAAWEDTVFGIKHRRDFGRFALVGAPDYVEWGMRLFAPIMSGEMRSFPADQATQAWEWIRQS